MGLFGRKASPVPADSERLATLEAEVIALRKEHRTLSLEMDETHRKLRSLIRREARGALEGEPATPAAPTATAASPGDLAAALRDVVQRGARGRIAARRLARALEPEHENGEQTHGVHP